jgi:hypothetical protein
MRFIIDKVLFSLYVPKNNILKWMIILQTSAVTLSKLMNDGTTIIYSISYILV